LGVGVEAQVRAVRDDDSTGLRGAEATGLLPGTRVFVRKRQHSDGLLMVDIGDPDTAPLVVELEVARRVFVVALPHDPVARGKE